MSITAPSASSPGAPLGPGIDEVVLPAAYNGPPGTANGGYAAGVVAEAVGPGATVRLSAPPPVGVPLVRMRGDDRAVHLLHRDTTVALGHPAHPGVALPAAPSLSDAVRASAAFAGSDGGWHPWPGCWVCGPQRGEEGLGVFPGPTGRGGVLASPWTPGDELAEDGVVPARFVWAALDCPTGWACMPPRTRVVLGTMTARVHRPVHAGRTYVVSAWPLGASGRKHRAAAALHTADGEPVAVADALWISVS